MTSLPALDSLPANVRSGLKKLGILDVQGLMLHLPLRYLDETHITPIRDVLLGEGVQIEGQIVHAELVAKPRKTLVLRVADASGELLIRFLHFYPSQLAMFKEGVRVRAMGEVRHGFFGYEMVHPQMRVVKEGAPVKETLTPVYPTTAGLTQPTLRKWIAWALQQGDTQECVPTSIYARLQLPSFADSLRVLHAPTPEVVLQTLEERSHPAWQRLAFDELLAQQLSMRKHYANRRERGAPALPASTRHVPKLVQGLPFALTAAQQRALQEISQDLTQPYPMQRLLQGDVGSGKTVVAALAALQAIEQGYQVAVMAPTELLAEQHANKMRGWLQALDLQVAWLSGSQGKRERNASLEQVASGQAHMVVGTHALFQEAVQFARLGLVIVDEQHRFGVEQRLQLRNKGQQGDIVSPHQLMMSATPIPRTLSMSYFADLDVSVIDALPPGRSPILTRVIEDSRRDEVLARVFAACQQGAQAYWVCPLIEESEALQLQTAIDTYQYISQTFSSLAVGLVHGRMKPREKQAVMEAFRQGALHVLVATTVIEVGVDVPNASLMVIEHAERMGLSQLHQLRGRVGRGSAKSVCLLMYQGPLSQQAKARLKAMHDTQDGFEISRIDLSLRGPGEFLGLRQSGAPMLKIADLERDVVWLEHAQRVAEQLLTTDPEAAEQHLQRWIGAKHELMKV